MMRTKTGILAAVAAAALCAAAPASSPAQVPKGQLVRLVARFNEARLAFVKRYAGDAAFARRIQQLASANNDAELTSAFAEVTGLPRSEVTVTATTEAPTSGESDALHGSGSPVRFAAGQVAHDASRGRTPGAGSRSALLSIKGCWKGGDWEFCVNIPLL